MSFVLDLGSVITHLKFDTTHATKGFATLSNVVDRAAKKVEWFGVKMTAAVSAPLFLIGREMVKDYAAFDQAITKSMAVMSDATASTRKELEKTALTLSTKVATSAVDLARGYFELGQAGLTAKQSIQLLPVVEKFAYAGTMDLSQAVSYLTKTQRALGMEMRDPIENMREMRKVSDNLTYAAIESTAEIIDFSEAMKNAGPMLRVLNKSVEEGTAALMTLANQGHVGSEAGMQLYMTLRDVQRAYITHKNIWKSLEIEVYDSTGKMRLLQDIIADLEKHYSSLSDEQTRASLMLMGFQDRSIRATQAMIGHSDSMKKFYKDLKDVGGLTEKVANQYLGAFNAQMSILSDKIKIIRIELGGIIAKQLEKLNSLMDKALSVWRAFDQPMKEFIVHLGEMAIIVGPVILAFGFLLKLFAGILALIGTILSPFGILIALLAQFALASDTAARLFGKTFKSIGEMIDHVSRKIRNWSKTDSEILTMQIKLFGIELEGVKSKFVAFLEYMRSDWSSSMYGLFTEVFVEALKQAGLAAMDIAMRIGQGISQAAQQGIFEGHFSKKEVDRRYEMEFKMREDQARREWEKRMSSLSGPAPSWVDPKIWAATQGALVEQEPIARDSWVYENIGVLGMKLKTKPTNQSLYTQIQADVEKDFREARLGTIAETVFQGFDDSLRVRLQTIKDKADDLRETLTYSEGMQKLGQDFLNIDEMTKSKQALLNVQIRVAQVRGYVEDTGHKVLKFAEGLKDAFVSPFTGAKERNELQRVSDKVARLMEALDPDIQERKQAQAQIYEGLMRQTGAFQAHKDLLDDQRVILESILGDNEQLALWYQRQIDLLTIEVGKYGDIAEQLQAASLQIKIEAEQAGGPWYQFAMEMPRMMENGFMQMAKDAENWKDHMVNMIEEVYWEFVRLQFVQPLAQGLSSGFSAGASAIGSAILNPGGTTAANATMAKYAEGGIAWNPQIAMVAEKGPELITPLSKLGSGKTTIRLINESGVPLEMTGQQEYMMSDQRIIDVSIRAAGSNMGYQKAHGVRR